MAYNNYPYGYMNPYVYGSTPLQTAQPPQNPQSSIVGISSEQDARNYPVAPGASVMFQDESAPYRFYTKTMGRSPLDTPVFEKYRLVKDDGAAEATEQTPKKEDVDLSAYALKTDLQPFESKIAALQKDISMLKERTKRKPVREVDDDYE